MEAAKCLHFFIIMRCQLHPEYYGKGMFDNSTMAPLTHLLAARSIGNKRKMLEILDNKA